MRWTNPNIGDTRRRTKILVFPLCINGHCRWLEKSSWIEEYTLVDNGSDIRNYWVPIKWDNEPRGTLPPGL